jgi:hypothetical protein
VNGDDEELLDTIEAEIIGLAAMLKKCTKYMAAPLEPAAAGEVGDLDLENLPSEPMEAVQKGLLEGKLMNTEMTKVHCLTCLLRCFITVLPCCCVHHML